MNTEKKARFNIVDVLIILAVIGIVTASFLRADAIDKFTETDDKTVIYIYEARDLKASSADYIAQGDNLYIKDTGKLIGRITKFEVKDAATIVETAEGKLIEGTLPGRIDVIITVETTGREKDGSVFINDGLFIAAGKELEVTTDKLTYSMVIEEVYIKNDTGAEISQ